jgi:hypothetical protein
MGRVHTGQLHQRWVHMVLYLSPVNRHRFGHHIASNQRDQDLETAENPEIWTRGDVQPRTLVRLGLSFVSPRRFQA